MSKGLVLSMFPGIGLLDMAFEEAGFTVVRGPDDLWGGDARKFSPPARFDGVIGGPPCQKHSNAGKIIGTEAIDLIPDYVRVVRESGAWWSVMENVPQALGHAAIPKTWNPVVLRDVDCGGLTQRTRAFWLWPMMMLAPGQTGRRASRSVMASTWKRGASKYVEDKGFLAGNLPVEEYGRLQGCQQLAEHLRDHPSKPGRSFIVHVLGNGVPLAMGRTVAAAVVEAVERRKSA